MPDTQVPAGWYPDPTGDTTKIRYWNGSAWTDEFMDASAVAGSATVPGAASAITGGADPYSSVSSSTAQTGGYPQGYPGGSAGSQPFGAQSSGSQLTGGQAYGGQTTGGQTYGIPQQPGLVQPPDKGRAGMAIAALVLGIVSILGCCIPILDVLLGAAALILGILSLKSSRRGMALAGVILGVIGVIFGIAYIAYFFLLYPDILANPEKYGLTREYVNSLTGGFFARF